WACGAAVVGQRLAVQGTIIDPLTAQGHPLLAEVDAHLMRASSLQAALDQGEIAKVFQNGDVRDGALPLAGLVGAAAAAVASILDQIRLDAPGPWSAAHQRQIA